MLVLTMLHATFNWVAIGYALLMRTPEYNFKAILANKISEVLALKPYDTF